MESQKVQTEFARALAALRVARLFQADGLGEDAVLWAYAAVSRATKAALLLHDRRAKTHAALRRSVCSTLVQSGQIEKEWARIWMRVQDHRINLTVNAHGPLFLATAHSSSLVADAEQFIERIRKCLEGAQSVAMEKAEEHP